MKERTKITLISGGIILLIIGVISLSYAFLSVTKKQSLANTFTSGCLNISIESESNAINLVNAYPIADIEGLETEGYTFTIKNTCNTSTNYMINLESLNQVANTLDTEYIKTSLSSDTMDNLIQKLSSNLITKTYVDGAYRSHNLYTGSIAGNTTKEFNLKIWMDYDTTKEQGASKVYTSKINVIANPDIEVTSTPEIKTTLVDNTLEGTITGSASSAKYCTSSNNICIPSTSTSINGNKISINVNRNNDEIVCIQLNSNKVTCSNKVQPTKASDILLATGELINENGYRYEGKDVNNNIIFNNEFWRIIGVFDTMKADGTNEELVKIIIDESVERISWDESDSNNWSTSSLQTLLNKDYCNQNGEYSSVGLAEEAQNMIEEVVWNLGGSSTYELTVEAFYNAERGTEVYSGNPTTWIGKIGLMYPSDYGYASPANTCNRSTFLFSYFNSGCYDNNWIENYREWTIMSNSSYNSAVFYVYDDGHINYDHVGNDYGVRPTLYLKSSVKITGGDGSIDSPYTLSYTSS